MSNSTYSSDLDEHTVQQIATLARLSLNSSQVAEYTQTLNKILHSMQHLSVIDTTGIEPLKSPFDHAQPLREDQVTEINQRESYQAVAPAVQAGLYLVPRVIE